MSPEQSRGETDLDVRTDVYSLSLLFYELLVLRHPLADKTTMVDLLRAVQEEETPFAAYTVPHPLQGTVPADLSWYIRAGVEKDRSKRYPSVQAMLERLDQRADGVVPVQCPITFVKRSTRMVDRFANAHPLAMIGLMVASVLAPIAATILALVVHR